MPDDANAAKRKEQAQLEGRQGFDLWRSVRRVINLYVNVRAPGVLSRLQAEMRAGKISDDMWDMYCSKGGLCHSMRFKLTGINGTCVAA